MSRQSPVQKPCSVASAVAGPTACSSPPTGAPLIAWLLLKANHLAKSGSISPERVLQLVGVKSTRKSRMKR